MCERCYINKLVIYIHTYMCVTERIIFRTFINVEKPFTDYIYMLINVCLYNIL